MIFYYICYLMLFMCMLTLFAYIYTLQQYNYIYTAHNFDDNITKVIKLFYSEKYKLNFYQRLLSKTIIVKENPEKKS